jgi:hypothetical protein
MNSLSWGTIDGPKREDRNSWAAKMARLAAEETNREKAIRAVQSLGSTRLAMLCSELTDLHRNGKNAEPLQVLDLFLERLR